MQYNLWRVVHRLHSASWWMLIEKKDGDDKAPGDLWKAAVLESRVETAVALPTPLSNGCYRVRRRLLDDLVQSGVQHTIEQVA